MQFIDLFWLFEWVLITVGSLLLIQLKWLILLGTAVSVQPMFTLYMKWKLIALHIFADCSERWNIVHCAVPWKEAQKPVYSIDLDLHRRCFEGRVKWRTRKAIHQEKQPVYSSLQFCFILKAEIREMSTSNNRPSLHKVYSGRTWCLYRIISTFLCFNCK